MAKRECPHDVGAAMSASHFNELGDPDRRPPLGGYTLTPDGPLLEDPRFLTKIVSRDPVTRSVFHFRIRRIDVPRLYSRKLISSGFLNPLSGRFRLVALTICSCVLTERFLLSSLRFPVSDLRRLAKIRANVKSILQRLEQLKAEIIIFERNTGSIKRRLSLMCERSHAALRRLQSEASKAKGVRGRKRDLEARTRAAWVFSRPALAYALQFLFENSPGPELTALETLRRIADFQIKFMGYSIAGAPTVRQQIYRFRQARHRARKMERIIRELLEGEWCSPSLPAGISASDIGYLFVQLTFP